MSPSITQMPSEVAELICDEIPIEFVKDSVLMKSLFPMSSPSSLWQHRSNPLRLLSAIVDNPKELLKSMTATKTILIGDHTIDFLYPGACKNPQVWSFYNDDSLHLFSFFNYLLRLGMKVKDASQKRSVLCTIYRNDRQNTMQFSTCCEHEILRLLEFNNTMAQCAITGYACISLQSGLSKYYCARKSIPLLDPWGDSHECSSLTCTASQFNFVDSNSRRKRNSNDKNSLVNHHPRIAFCSNNDYMESLILIDATRSYSWKENKTQITSIRNHASIGYEHIGYSFMPIQKRPSSVCRLLEMYIEADIITIEIKRLEDNPDIDLDPQFADHLLRQNDKHIIVIELGRAEEIDGSEREWDMSDKIRIHNLLNSIGFESLFEIGLKYRH